MIKSSNLKYLRNEEFMALISSVLTTLYQSDLSSLGMKSYVENLGQVFGTLKDHYKAERGSEVNRSLVTLDGARDLYFVAMRSLLAQHAQGHPKEAMRQAASIVLEALETHGPDLYRKSYEEQTIGMKSVFETIDSSKELSEAINDLYLNDYYQAMKGANEEFDRAYMEQNDQYTPLPKEKLVALRDRCEAEFDILVQRINAHLMLAEDPEDYLGLAEEIDYQVNKYQEVASSGKSAGGTGEELNAGFSETAE